MADAPKPGRVANLLASIKQGAPDAASSDAGPSPTFERPPAFVVEQDYRTGKLTVYRPGHHWDSVSFLVNETVLDTETQTSFYPKASADFRREVLAIWGPGGPRTTTKKVLKCNACGSKILDADDLECGCSRARRDEAGTALVQADRFDEAVDFDGSLLPLGRRPNAGHVDPFQF